MATYYIRKTGSNSNNGTSAATAWLTLGKALASGSTVVAGDTIYVGAGVYRETVAVAVSGSSGSPIKVIGDVTGQYTGDAGQVTQTAYTTNDKTAPVSTTLLALGTQTYLQFSNMTFMGGTGQTITCSAGGHDYTFTDCVINGINNTLTTVQMTGSATGPVIMNVTFDRCSVFGFLSAITFTLPTTTSGAADYDANCIVRNCYLQGFNTTANGVVLSASGTSTYKPGGVRVYNCTILGPTNGCSTTTASQISTTVPGMVVSNSLIFANTGLNSGTSGQMTESYNAIYASTPRTNVTAGTGSISDKSYAPLVELGQSYKWSGQVKPFMRPDTNSPLLGFSNAGYSGNYPTVDFYSRPRPSGGGSVQGGASYASVGYLESHDNAIQDTVTYPSGQTSSGKLVGPGDQDLLIPVDASSTTVSVQLYQGSGYGGTTYATASVLSNGELGVTAQTLTCSSTLSSWQTLTFSAFTPSKKGWITLRITSYDTSGTGTLNFGAVV